MMNILLETDKEKYFTQEIIHILLSITASEDVFIKDLTATFRVEEFSRATYKCPYEELYRTSSKILVLYEYIEHIAENIKLKAGETKKYTLSIKIPENIPSSYYGVNAWCKWKIYVSAKISLGIIKTVEKEIIGYSTYDYR
ncbi:MAG: hypothetical protein ABGF52_06885 [Candidatus Asgardarchaeum sp.]